MTLSTGETVRFMVYRNQATGAVEWSVHRSGIEATVDVLEAMAEAMEVA